METIFFSPFFKGSCQWKFFSVWWKRIFQRKSSFRLVETNFLAGGNHFILFRDFSSWWKPSLKLMEANFLEKDHVLTDENWFSGNHFLPPSQTAVNCYQWKQFFLNLEHIFWLIVHSCNFLSAGNSIVLFRAFFCQWKLLLEIGASQFLKKSHISASGHQVFNFFQRFLKWKQLSHIVERHFSISFTRLA